MKKILFIDDEINIYNVIKKFLPKQFYFDYASDGLKGLHLYYHNKYNLIITDNNMPGLSGMELIEEIRKKDTDIPIILITGDNSITKKDVIILYKPFFMDKIKFLIDLIEQKAN